MRYPKKGDKVRWIGKDLDVGVHAAARGTIATWTENLPDEEFQPKPRTNFKFKVADMVYPPGTIDMRCHLPGPYWDPRKLGVWFELVEDEENEFGPVSP